MFNHILVVCMGNICRSPTAERVLQHLLPNKTVASAGLAVKRSRLEGAAADNTASLVAQEHDISLEGHQARQLTAELCQQYDLILVMEKQHINLLSEIAPAARGKTMLLGQWDGQREIPDPHRQSKEAFLYVYDLIEQTAGQWAKKL